MAVHRHDQGNETVGGKVDMSHALSRLAQHLFRLKFDGFEASEQPTAKCLRQSSQQLVTGGGLGRSRHLCGSCASITTQDCDGSPCALLFGGPRKRSSRQCSPRRGRMVSTQSVCPGLVGGVREGTASTP